MAVAKPDLIDAHAAMEALGVKAQTLYAYVSRGLIRSVNPERRKASLYYREDVEALQMRGRTKRANDNVAQRALRVGGGAVMQTAITAITDRGPSYRGHLAIDLAIGGRSFEQCAELLWSGLLPASEPRWGAPVASSQFTTIVNAVRTAAPGNSSRRLLSLVVEAWACSLGPDPEISARAPILAARDAIAVMANSLGLLRARPTYVQGRNEQSIAERLARSLGISATDDNVSMLNAALVLCADHELAPATFAARIAASAGADIHSCISSALGAFEGLATGLGCDSAERALRKGTRLGPYVNALSAAARQKLPLPGFNHPMYAHGDPRANTLLQLIVERKSSHVPSQQAIRCIEGVRSQIGAQPSLTVSLAALSIALELPVGSSAAVMALGRTAGWIAHIYEQRTAGFLVRPRAKYVGLGL